MTEQLGVDELGRDGAAVDAAERAAPERRVLVDDARDDLLARAGFAKEQDGRAAAGDHARAGHDRGEPRLPTDQALLVDGRIARDELLGPGRLGRRPPIP